MGEILTSVDDAAAIVGRGGLVVVPTETVYGFACRPEADAVARLRRTKQRPDDRSIQLLVPGADWLDRLARPSRHAQALADAFWPGPLTLVLPAADDAPPALVFDGTIGVRVPAHALVLDLLARTGPLAASSANVTGEPTPPTVEEIRAIFTDQVDGYLDGGRVAGVGSTVLDLTGDAPEMLREGPIMRSDVERIISGRFADE